MALSHATKLAERLPRVQAWESCRDWYQASAAAVPEIMKLITSFGKATSSRDGFSASNA